MDAAAFWKRFPKNMPIDKRNIQKWNASLDKHYQINVIGSHRKGMKLSGPPLNKRVLVLIKLFLWWFQIFGLLPVKLPIKKQSKTPIKMEFSKT